MKGSTFNSNQVANYLKSIGRPVAGEIVEVAFPGRVESEVLLKWFKRNFGRAAQRIFREMECHVTQQFDLL